MKIKNLHRFSGFTLMELMVVIAILGTLMAVAAPLLLSRLSAADVTNCQSNVKQIVQLGLKYSEDFSHKGLLPTSGMDDDEDTEEYDESEAWWYSIAPLMDDVVLPSKGRKNMKVSTIFHCPGDSRAILEDGATMDGTAKNVSYVSWTDGTEDKGNPNSGIRLSSKQRLDEMPWISDGNPVLGESVKNAEDFKKMVLPALERHEETIVVGYASGVVRAVVLDPDETDEKVHFAKVAPWLAEQQEAATSKRKTRRKSSK